MSTDPNINIMLGAKLKKIRNEQKITREALSEMIDISSRFMADVESGKVGVSLATLKKICRVLGVSADYLLGLTENEENSGEYERIVNRIRQTDIKHLPYLEEIITAFVNAVEVTDSN